ncbi:MmgE/PrpD family protein [Variovorax rhizosphaerae]|uniref:MmgE/PrpD family protein n=1 Tax=Variovorax rhizosphaerae TaxID=1836200 RepID=A0ABU8WTA5_9BURK
MQATTTTLPAARQLAEWALGLQLCDIDPHVVERVKLHLLDQIGAQVSCRELPTCRITQEYVSKFGTAGTASILGTRLRLDPESAAFANGTSGSSFEIDDYGGKGANCHPGCTVVPAVFAIGEAKGASGAEVLRAAVVGFETVIRLALASMPSLLLERGFHHTGSLGVFAVALASAMIERDDVEVAVNAIAIAGSHASGTTEFAQSGGEVKRVHAGISVAAGIRSARLARLGLNGPPTILEGSRGFLQAFCNDFDARYLTEELGMRWHFPERASIKLYASCALMQPHFAAYDMIKAEHAFSAQDVEEVILGCDPLAFVHTGSVGPRPKDVLGAQFSAEYGVAMRIVRGSNDVGSYLDLEAIGFEDPAILAMAERTRLERDPECTFERPLGRVTLRLRDGRTLSASSYAPGSPQNPVSRDDIQRKYRELVSRDFGDEVARRSMDLIMNLEEVTNLGQITGLFEGAKA